MIKTLVDGLTQIHLNLDVECTCHAHHGPMCPKRIAANALVEWVREPETDPSRGRDFGYITRTLSQNAQLVEACTRAIVDSRGLKEMFPERDSIPEGMIPELREQARAVLMAVDAFTRGYE